MRNFYLPVKTLVNKCPDGKRLGIGSTSLNVPVSGLELPPTYRQCRSRKPPSSRARLGYFSQLSSEASPRDGRWGEPQSRRIEGLAEFTWPLNSPNALRMTYR